MRKYLMSAALLVLANPASALDGGMRVTYVRNATKSCVDSMKNVSTEKAYNYCGCFSNKTADGLTIEEVLDTELGGVNVKNMSEHVRGVIKEATVSCAKKLD